MLATRVRAALAGGLLCAGCAAAQPHRLGYLAGSWAGTVLAVDPRGAVKTFRIGANPVFGLTMDVDNRLAVVCHYRDEVLRIDPLNGAVLGTIFKGYPLAGVRDVAIDHQGDYYVTDSVLNGVLRISPGGRIFTVRLDAFRLDCPYGGLAIDADTGDLLLLDVAYDDALLRLSRDGTTLTTLGTGFDGRYGFAQDIPTGEIYAGSGGGPGGSIERLKPYRNRAEVFATYPGLGMLALRMDRASAHTRRLVGTGSGRAGGIWFVDPVTARATSFARFGQDAYEVEFLRGRNLQTVRRSPGRWEIRISFPDSPARAFILAASLRGPRPALMTPDGRTLNLGPDPLLFATLARSLPPLLTGSRGVLNLAGEARAALDLRTLGPRLNGLRIWFAAIVLDPAAPSGIHVLSDPYPFVVEGLLDRQPAG